MQVKHLAQLAKWVGRTMGLIAVLGILYTLGFIVYETFPLSVYILLFFGIIFAWMWGEEYNHK